MFRINCKTFAISLLVAFVATLCLSMSAHADTPVTPPPVHVVPPPSSSDSPTPPPRCVPGMRENPDTNVYQDTVKLPICPVNRGGEIASPFDGDGNYYETGWSQRSATMLTIIGLNTGIIIGLLVWAGVLSVSNSRLRRSSEQ